MSAAEAGVESTTQTEVREPSGAAVEVILIQGAGAGAHEADALLAASLAEHLGDGFTVDFPLMPDEDEPDDDRWSAAIGAAIDTAAIDTAAIDTAAIDTAAIDPAASPAVLVGHSAGGYLLLKHLAKHPPTQSIAALCIIAAPFPGADPAWTFDDFELPDDLAERLPAGVPVLLYASEDDAIVPFAHLDHYARAIPGAIVRTVTGGHQLGNDLRVVAEDIRAVVVGPA